MLFLPVICYNIAFGTNSAYFSFISVLSFGMSILYIGKLGLSNAKKELSVISFFYTLLEKFLSIILVYYNV